MLMWGDRQFMMPQQWREDVWVERAIAPTEAVLDAVPITEDAIGVVSPTPSPSPTPSQTPAPSPSPAIIDVNVGIGGINLGVRL